MQVSGFFRQRLSIALAIAITWTAIPWPAPLEAGSQRLPLTTSRNESGPVARLALRELTEQEAILHALNRLGFGPRPGDVERVRAMGLDHWIEGQLHPESLEDSALTARLERYPTLTMSATQLLREYPRPQRVARREGQDRAAVRRDRERAPRRIVAELSAAKLTRAIHSERQLHEMMVDFWFNHFNVFAGKGADRWLVTSFERDAIRPHAMGKFRDLLEATAKSPAMLFYLDNWLSADPKSAERLQREMERRRQSFERRFRNNPEMRERMGRRAAQGQQPNLRRRSGLNENYARELMELHTLGVDGGYTQGDVIQVARALTGWTLRQPRRNPEFYFEARLHDPNPKVVLGKRISAGGMKDGEAVLDLLAGHPSTARFIATKLAERFVSDEPPAELVRRMADAFRETGGDIRAVLRTMIESPEFWSRQAYRAKIKMPFELVVSAARALGADVIGPMPLVMWTARIGQPLYLCQTPNGYSSQAAAWVNSGALLNRLNFALALAGGRLPGALVSLSGLAGADAESDPQRTLNGFLELLLGGDVTEQTRKTLEEKISDSWNEHTAPDGPAHGAGPRVIAGLILGSPEFQRR